MFAECCHGTLKGQMMKTIFVLLLLAFSGASSAACYLIYTPANELVWRRGTPPVRMDTLSINDEVQRIVPKGHMVIGNMTPEECPDFDLTAPDRTMRQKAEEMKYD
jgi:hypothetical protein